MASSELSTHKKTKICVFCGSSPGFRPEHMDMARSLAHVMAANNISLVYGGGTVGIMGELARTLVQLSGPDSVHGIIPEALVKYERDNEHASNDSASDKAPLPVPSASTYGKTTVVKDMHSRKQLMAREVLEGGPGSGFIAMSGGYGTLEELLETTTWNQLGIHSKGICVLNVNGFFDGLLSWISSAAEEGFINKGNVDIIAQATDAEGAVKALQEYKVAPSVFKLAWGST